MLKRNVFLLLFICAIGLSQQINLNLTVFPLCIPADGSSTSLITVTAKDPAGYPLPDGTIVELSTNLGQVSPSEVTLNNSLAIATLKSTTSNGTAVISAKCEGITATAYAYFANPPKDMALMQSAQSAPADGASPIFIYAFVYDDNPQGAVADGTPVKFSSTIGNITPIAYTYGGQAVAKITSSTPGNAVITAECGSAKATTAVTFLSGAPKYIEISATSIFLQADGKSKITVIARVYGENNTLVADGIPVSFQTTAGSITPMALTEKGTATATLTAPTTPRKATVTAKCGEIEGKMEITFTGPPAHISLSWLPYPQLSPEGIASLRLSAQVTDADYHPVGPDCVVSFSSTRGEITSSNITDSRGVADALLKLPAEDGEVEVSASIGSLREAKTLKLTTKPRALRLVALPTSVPADGKSRALIQCYVVTPREEIFVGGNQVSFSTDRGKIFPRDEGRIREGVAEAFLLSDLQPGIANVSATIGKSTASLPLIFSSNPTSLSLTIYPPTPTPGGTVYIKAEVKDAQNNIVADGTSVRFVVKGRDTSRSFEGRTNNGVAVISVQDLKAGEYEIEATSGEAKIRTTFTCK